MAKLIKDMTPEELEELDREFEETLMTEEEKEQFRYRLKNHKLPEPGGPAITYGGTWSFNEEGELILWP